MVAMAGVLALLVVALVGAFVIVPLARNSRQLRREREHAHRKATAESRDRCEHVWAQWEFVDTSILYNKDNTAAIGRIYTQKRDCLVCGYTQMHRKTLTN